MIGWLVDTFVATAGFLAAALVLRRPVARAFGPGLAYALWFVPLARLVLPPLVLPASFAPRGAVAGVLPAGQVTTVSVVPAAMPASGWTATDGLIALWLAGAAAFLVWRLVSYRAMRAQLLQGVRPMGEAGRVRIVESDFVDAPVAFGVVDKVVALPRGFMARPDVRGRDLAIAHELQHHAGHDLVVTFAFQLLLALHWFNPLAWAAWRAMRRDQEAACDARVIASHPAGTRATYGALIASFAGGPRLGLAAPMACPVLGEKSVIHRLRSLTMPDLSPRRRRLGRAFLGASLLAVPLTATVSFAAEEPPAPPAPPAPRIEQRMTILGQAEEGQPAGDAGLHTRVIERDGRTIVLKTNRPLTDAEVDARIAELPQPPAPPVPPVPPAAGADGVAPPPPAAPIRRMTIVRREGGPDALAMAAPGDCATPREFEASEGEGGARKVVRLRICEAQAAKANAADAVRRARSRIEQDSRLSASMRAEILRELDEEIARLGEQGS